MENNNVYSSQSKTMTLNKHVSRTFIWVFVGLLVSAVAAFATIYTPLANIVFGSGIGYLVLTFAEFGTVIYLSSRIYEMSYQQAAIAYFAYCFLSGMTLSAILAVYAESGITFMAFILTAVLFLDLAYLGGRSKYNLDSFGGLLFGGLIALVITTLVGMFLHIESLSMIICYAGIVIFMGLTAYDTQKIKKSYYYYQGDEYMLSKLSIYSALQLYLDFVNIFLYVIRLLGRGNRRN